MAITSAQLQAELGTNGMNAKVLRAFGTYGTEQHWLVQGNVDAPGRVRMVKTTASDNAATQAASVLTALRA
jgi:hypothetical protein